MSESLNPNRAKSRLSDEDKERIELERAFDTPDKIEKDIESVYDYAKTLNKVGDQIDRLEAALHANGHDTDDKGWASPDEGIDGAAGLVHLAERLHAYDNYELAPYEEKFVNYMDSVVKVEEARASISGRQVLDTYPGNDVLDDALHAHIEAKLENDKKNLEQLTSADPAIVQEAKQRYKGDPRRLPGTVINEERTVAYLENSDHPKYGNALLEAGEALAQKTLDNNTDEVFKAVEALDKAEEAAAEAQKVNFSVADTLTSVARQFPNEDYRSPVIEEQLAKDDAAKQRAEARKAAHKAAKPQGKANRRRQKGNTPPINPDDDAANDDEETQQLAAVGAATGSASGRGNSTRGSSGAGRGRNRGRGGANSGAGNGNQPPINPGDHNQDDDSGQNNTPEQEQPQKSREYIRTERMLLGVQRGLAQAQAELTSSINPWRRKDLKEKAAKLEKFYDDLVKRISLLEIKENPELVASDNLPDYIENILSVVENKVAERYDTLATMTGEQQGSGGMEFLEKHGTKIALGATAVGAVVGMGIGGGVTGAAVGLGIKAMTKIYNRQKGRYIGRMGNFKETDSDGNTFVTNPAMREALRAALENLPFPQGDPNDPPEVRMANESRYAKAVFDTAFDTATSFARDEYNKAIHDEYYKGTVAAYMGGAATAATVYGGGHILGNILYYQFFGGPGGFRWALSTLDSHGQTAAQLLPKVGYTPSSMSMLSSAFSNFAPF